MRRTDMMRWSLRMIGAALLFAGSATQSVLGKPPLQPPQPCPNDCNLNGIPDECDVSCSGSGMSCPPPGQLWLCSYLTDCGALDCNQNGVPDDCDPPMVLYVDASALPGTANRGCSWASAYKDLQDALDFARPGDEIWIAGGTYKPDRGTGDRSASFVLKDGVALYGGFNGDETCYDPTDCAASKAGRTDYCVAGPYVGLPCNSHLDCPESFCGGMGAILSPTKLSGDLTIADSTPVDAEHCGLCEGTWDPGAATCTVNGVLLTQSMCDNSLHVVTYATPDANVVLDGLTVRDGYADGSLLPDNQGSGLQIRNGSNQCLSGGPTVSDCIFDDNWADNHGAVNDHAASSSYTNCVFKNNRAARGAGLLVDNGSPTITDCLFLDNATNGGPNQGGGAWFGHQAACGGTSAPTVTGSLFEGNFAMEGGGIWSTDADPTILSTEFTQNMADGTWTPETTLKVIDGMGGGLFLMNAGPGTTVADCSFQSNDAEDAGGGMFIRGCSSLMVSNCTFDDNATFRESPGSFNTYSTHYSGGGALWNEASTSTTVSQCLFDHNHADAITQYGGAVFNTGSNNLKLEDCRFYGNRAGYVGGAVYEERATNSTHINCEYVGNAARPYHLARGGAIATLVGAFADPQGPSDIHLVNCTITENEVLSDNPNDVHTGGVYISGSGSQLTATNCIFWMNRNRADGATDQTAQIGFDDASELNSSITYSIWQSYADDPPVPTTSVRDEDPQFVVAPAGGSDGWVDDPGTPGIDEGADDNFPDVTDPLCFPVPTDPCCTGFDVRLQHTSSGIDAGDNTLVAGVTYDVVGNLRLVEHPARINDEGNPTGACPMVDLGAYEHSGSGECCPAPCNQGEVCCNGNCVSGDCCVDADCDADQECSGTYYCHTTDCCVDGDCAPGESCVGNICQ